MPGAHILLIEDDEVLCDLISKNLLIRGHEIDIAVDGQKALNLLRQRSYDLILLDINLPDQTGWDVLRTAQREHLVASQKSENDTIVFPIIVLSAVRVSPSRLSEFHPLAYLPKPFPMDALLRFAAQAAQKWQTHTDEAQGKASSERGG